ncbi:MULTISPECIES: hypothetical protein [Bacillus]|uniref:Uncharacterized protein n=3 Tax=Bacillus thuringiensis TaxID=1428 RepID=A0AAP4V6W4_BACTU|nr:MULTISPECIES: hypothetical protein [Bacillus]MEC2876712.1 hypothetical protein [Bacillus cereus]AEA15495.1 Phage protein [Bacillus thuringiensis serovar chinensis CT-43]AFV17618.1 phage protein [Bacillus thuringiensis Bt407]AGG00550.1 Phage protein [Bacillus thuringiensis serovar thuringiensis str. IS5056]EEM27422.1 hypothetical protein bthur0002_37710 [Bacillus thuringiensis Bt407]
MGGRQQGKGYENRKSDRKLEKLKREMVRQKRKVAKGEPRKAVVYLDNSEQQLKDVMQENRDLQLEVDLYKSQVKVKDNYAKRVLKENNELREKNKGLRKKFLALVVSYMIAATIVSLVVLG